jgi:valyl-tRNA synthetase
MGWPEKTADFNKYYPTSLLVTAYDILFFWVARMIMMGLHFTGKVPFRTVYLHALVRTGSGEKMSKSKGTGLDPVVLNQRFGTDAMRFCLASMAAPGTDIILSDDKLGSARNFANKIWNAARFLFVNLDKFEQTGAKLEALAGPEVRAKSPYRAGGKMALADAWLFARLAATIETVNDALASYRFHEAAQGVYQFFWGDFCDWYIEWVKPGLLGQDRERATASWKNLFAAFDAALRLLHPFMPFLTEELWHQLPQPEGTKSIALGRFPEPEARWKNAEAMREVAQVQEVVTALRAIRGELRLDAKKKVAAEFSTDSGAMGDLIRANREAVERFAGLSELRMVPKERFDAKSGALRSTAMFDVRVVYSETVDSGAESARLKKETSGLQKAIGAKEQQLADQTFRSRAPERIIRGLEATLAQQKVELEKLRKRLRDLEGGGQAARI